MYRIALCDDEKEILELLEETLQNYGLRHHFEVDLRRFHDSDTLMEMIEVGKLFDAYFLDIAMPAPSGMDLVRAIRGRTPLPVIVLLTGYEQYAIEACGMNIFRYVLKSQWSRHSERLLEDLFIQLSHIRNEKFYLISNQRKHVMFQVEDIISIYKKSEECGLCAAGERR